jgi:hypothetical protein
MTNLKCHFDSDGWLRGPISITHLFTPSHGTGFGTGRGVVMHTEAGFEQGTVATFMNRANGVSAFFSIGQDGRATQYLPVGKGYSGWSQVAGNDTFRGIEDEDRTHPSIPLTDAQMTTFAQIFEACSAFDGFPLQVTDSVGGQGLILHSDGGQNWGGHLSCPGPVRAAQRKEIVKRAAAIRAGTHPAPSVRSWTSSGQLTLAQLAKQELHEQVCTVLRVTAEAGGAHAPFAPAVAAYVNHVFATDTQVCPAGITLLYPGGTWVTKGQLSLDALASEQLKSTPAQVLALTCQGSRDRAFEPDVASYINAVFAKSAVKPAAGTVFHY